MSDDELMRLRTVLQRVRQLADQSLIDGAKLREVLDDDGTERHPASADLTAGPLSVTVSTTVGLMKFDFPNFIPSAFVLDARILLPTKVPLSALIQPAERYNYVQSYDISLRGAAYCKPEDGHALSWCRL